MKNAINGFIEALKKWNEITEEKALDFSSLLFLISFDIGIRSKDAVRGRETDKAIKLLEERINYLINNEKMSEIFIIKSLTDLVTRHFKYRIETHGDSLSFYLKAVEVQPEMEDFRESIDRLKSYNYFLNVKNDYFRWQEIVAQYLSEEIFDKWETKLKRKHINEATDMLEKMSGKYGNTTIGEIINNKQS